MEFQKKLLHTLHYTQKIAYSESLFSIYNTPTSLILTRYPFKNSQNFLQCVKKFYNTQKKLLFLSIMNMNQNFNNVNIYIFSDELYILIKNTEFAHFILLFGLFKASIVQNLNKMTRKISKNFKTIYQHLCYFCQQILQSYSKEKNCLSTMDIN